jgi:bifunctional UDP-N-acetylglucosamine pyrophosphorylase / glucosamine-1-phosphate N-acetyltransferase
VGDRRICAVIPAAGRGTRLGSSTPKIMLRIADGVTVWHLLHRRLGDSVEHVHVVVSPEGAPAFRGLAADHIRRGTVSLSVQDEPRGMGDAIFGAYRNWVGHVLVVWGDQASLSPVTVGRVVRAHRQATSTGRPGLTIPLVSMRRPYVEYELASGALWGVRMSREGDECRSGGFSDVGVFCLSTNGLLPAWRRYLSGAVAGNVTGELNFLPFLPRLSRIHGWRVTVVPVADPDEARGINTAEDLEFARQAFLRCER